MAKIAFLIGIGNFGEDLFQLKLPVIRNLYKNHEIYISSRFGKNQGLYKASENKYSKEFKYLKKIVGEEPANEIKDSIDEMQNITKVFSAIHDSPYLKRDYSKEEINEIQRWLGISFNYISSFDRRFYDREKKEDIREKNEIDNFFAGLTYYFRNFFTKNEIEFYINTVEDTAITVTAYYVAKRLGIKIIIAHFGRFPKKSVFFSKDFSEICTWNKNNLNENGIYSLFEESATVKDKTLNQDTKYYNLNWIISIPKLAIERLQRNRSYKKFLKYVISIDKYEEFIYDPISFYAEFKKPFISLFRHLGTFIISKSPNYDDKYLFFPLHYADDAQLTFMEPLVDQIKIVGDLSRTLPSNYYLYIKPHPHFLGTDMSLKELLKISKLRNVRIIKPLVSSIKLIKNSVGVATINSTTGFEALIIGTPVLSMGHDFYCREDLCYIVRDINDFPSRIMEMIVNGDKYKCKYEFLTKTYNNTIWIEGDIRKGEILNCLTKYDGEKIAIALDLIF